MFLIKCRIFGNLVILSMWVCINANLREAADINPKNLNLVLKGYQENDFFLNGSKFLEQKPVGKNFKRFVRQCLKQINNVQLSGGFIGEHVTVHQITPDFFENQTMANQNELTVFINISHYNLERTINSTLIYCY